MKQLREHFVGLKEKVEESFKNNEEKYYLNLPFFELDLRDMEEDSPIKEFLLSEVSYYTGIDKDFISVSINVDFNTKVTITIYNAKYIFKDRAKLVMSDKYVKSLENSGDADFIALSKLNGQTLKVQWPRKVHSFQINPVNFKVNGVVLNISKEHFQLLGV